jgi:hypothetical protein
MGFKQRVGVDLYHCAYLNWNYFANVAVSENSTTEKYGHTWSSVVLLFVLHYWSHLFSGLDSRQTVP